MFITAVIIYYFNYKLFLVAAQSPVLWIHHQRYGDLKQVECLIEGWSPEANLLWVHLRLGVIGLGETQSARPSCSRYKPNKLNEKLHF